LILQFTVRTPAVPFFLVAMLDPGAVRRLCCDAQVIPVVMGGPSEVLDVGRDQRTVDPGRH
jgi:hypothetical protein